MAALAGTHEASKGLFSVFDSPGSKTFKKSLHQEREIEGGVEMEPEDTETMQGAEEKSLYYPERE